jgi:hypothetical protein
MPGIEAGTTAAPRAILNAIANGPPAEAAAAGRLFEVWREPARSQ